MERIIAANDRICFINQKDDDSKSPMYKCEGLFADFLRKFKPSHGQLKSVWMESDRVGKPAVILSAPNAERPDEEITEISRLAVLHCLGEDTSKRRRYALINYRTYSFIIGGYELDMKNRRRLRPAYDFVYDIEKKTCRSIPAFPSPGRVAFGIAPSERYLVIIGGQTYDNNSLSSAFILDTQNIDQGWKKLPPYPHALLAPGVACSENRVIVIGGYDIVAGETDMLSSHHQMDLNEKIWRKYADLYPPRARSLVVCASKDDESELYVAGGYNHMHGKATVVDKIYSYNAKKDKWKKLTDIPHLQITDAITVAENKLTISEEVSNPNNPEESEMNPIRIYDFDTNEWTEMKNEGDNPPLRSKT